MGFWDWLGSLFFSRGYNKYAVLGYATKKGLIKGLDRNSEISFKDVILSIAEQQIASLGRNLTEKEANLIVRRAQVRVLGKIVGKTPYPEIKAAILNKVLTFYVGLDKEFSFLSRFFTQVIKNDAIYTEREKVTLLESYAKKMVSFRKEKESLEASVKQYFPHLERSLYEEEMALCDLQLALNKACERKVYTRYGKVFYARGTSFLIIADMVTTRRSTIARKRKELSRLMEENNGQEEKVDQVGEQREVA